MAPLVLAGILLSAVLGTAVALTHSLTAGVAAAGIVWLAWNAPFGLLIGLLAAAPLVRTGHSATLPPLIIAYAKTATALVLGGVVFVRLALTHTPSRTPRWVQGLLSAWAALTALAVLHSTDRGSSLIYLSLSVSGLALFWLTLRLTSSQRHRALAVVLGMGGLIGGVVLLQYLIVTRHVATFLERFIVEPRTSAYFDSNLVPQAAERYRPSGTMSHPNAMGLYFALLIPFCLVLWGVKGLKPRYRLGALAIAALMTAGLYTTDSRAAALWLVAALVYLAAHKGYRWLLSIGAGIAILGSVAVAALPAGQAFLEASTARMRLQYGLSGRPLIWHNTFELLQTVPWLGVGPGNFSHRYVDHFGFFVPNDVSELNGQIWAAQTLGDQNIFNFHAHNTYLQLAGEAGVGAPLLFLLGLFGIVVHAERRRRLGWPSFDHAMALAAAASAVGFMAYGFFDSQLAFTLGSINLVAGPLLALGLKPDRGLSLA